MDDIIRDLRKAYEGGNLVVLAGAGVSAGAGLPGWGKLAERVLEKAKARGLDPAALAEAEDDMKAGRLIESLSALKMALGPQEFCREIERQVDDAELPVPALAEAIAALKPKLRAVVTTNLDGFLERAFQGAWPVLTKPPGDLGQRRKYILKAHGTLLDRSTWVFTRDQYDRAMFATPELQQTLGALYRACTLMFVGSGLADDNLDLTLGAIRAIAGEQPPEHYAILPEPIGPNRRRTLEAAGLRLITYPAGQHGEAVKIVRSLVGP